MPGKIDLVRLRQDDVGGNHTVMGSTGPLQQPPVHEPFEVFVGKLSASIRGRLGLREMVHSLVRQTDVELQPPVHPSASLPDRPRERCRRPSMQRQFAIVTGVVVLMLLTFPALSSATATTRYGPLAGCELHAVV